SLTAITSLDRMRLQLVSLGDSTSFLGAAQAQSQPPGSDGTFKVDNVLPGDYRVNVTGMPPGYYLKSVRLEAIDAIDQPLKVTTSAAGPLEVVISPNGGVIEGTIVDDKQQPVRDTQAVLAPDRQRNR